MVGNYVLSPALKNSGFLCLSFDDFQKEIEKGKVFNHQFLVYEEDNVFKEITDDFSKLEFTKAKTTDDKPLALEIYKSVLPKRKLIFPKGEISELKDNNSIVNFLWQEWGKVYEIGKAELNNGVPSIANSIDFHILNHGPSYIADEVQKFNLTKWFECVRDNENYIEAISSKAQQKLPYFNQYSKSENDNDLNDTPLQRYLRKAENIANYPFLFYPIAESAKTKILIIDERIQLAAFDEKNKVEGFLLNDHYRQSYITIPEEKINLGANNLDTIKSSLFELIDKYIKESKITNTFILFHYSILERLYKDENNKVNAVNEYLIKISKRINVVVTSGRGIPPELPSEVSFVNLSPILASLIEFKSKYYFTQIIMSSRKSNKI